MIKVEEPEKPGGEESPWKTRHGPDFQNLHRNKRSLSLNLKEPEGLAIFKKLATQADVVVEKLPPGREAPAQHRLRNAEEG